MDLLTLRLTPQHLVLLDASGQHTRHNRNGHHHEERQREARQGKTDLPIGEGKDIVHSKHARHSGDDAEKVSFREQRRQKHIHEEDDRHIAGVIVGIERAKEEAQHRRYSKENHRYENVFDEIDSFVWLISPLRVFFLAINMKKFHGISSFRHIHSHCTILPR